MEVVVSGPPGGQCGSGSADDRAPLMVFVHGWPDDGRVWAAQVAHFRKNYRCAVVTLPGFGPEARVMESGSERPSEHNFDELSKMLAQEIRDIQMDLEDRAILVLHDWGSVIGFTMEDMYPDLVAGIVAIDVGPPTLDHPRVKDVPAMLTIGLLYHYMLIWAYFLYKMGPHGLGERLGNAISRMIARRVGAPHPEQALAASNYTYYYFHRNFVAEFFGATARSARYTKKPSSPQTTPTLFIYGVQKPIMLHSLRWVQNLKASPDCHVIPVKAGHWIMHEVDPQELNRKISNFIDLNI
mmetsp:Transcript_1054/g.2566  ORF Transcript_1054/g.2566 Transcript_1054/m.2566 type:complete len:297 (+) Transcript_1054:120-1010(+)|eukprot:CAMPEP_0171581112 /NCGR_PEP_ID=MMETSP0961-20121227/9420_1 /TAXON_ID=87120 /ORGANISM="Aurantiochytrium limacinum, Strain ATCCMYA-1381" /LENGTH=296 /DNA_ID=CAMNT_0012137879 /DNA_START=60 /DNA_END=950 /DNA_ORIENTATION=+